MASTILSENQYEAKLVAAANMKPSTMPWPPPRTSPRSRNAALITPRSRAVLIVFDIVLNRRRATFLYARDPLPSLICTGTVRACSDHDLIERRSSRQPVPRDRAARRLRRVRAKRVRRLRPRQGRRAWALRAPR